MHSSISINKDTSSNLILSFHHLINSHNKQEPDDCDCTQFEELANLLLK